MNKVFRSAASYFGFETDEKSRRKAPRAAEKPTTRPRRRPKERAEPARATGGDQLAQQVADPRTEESWNTESLALTEPAEQGSGPRKKAKDREPGRTREERRSRAARLPISIGLGRNMGGVVERHTDDTETRLPAPELDKDRPVAARSFSGRTLLAILVIIALIVPLAPTVHRYFEQQAEIDALNQSISSLQDQKKDLKKQEDLWKDDDYARQQARERLFYVTPGETPYAVTGQDADSRKADQSSAEAETQEQPDWGMSLWSSLAASSQGQ